VPMSEFAVPSPTDGLQAASDVAATVDVECVFADQGVGDRVASWLADRDGFAVERSADPEAVLERLEATDCVVTDEDRVVDLVEEMSDRAESAPVVFYTDDADASLPDEVLDDEWVDVVRGIDEASLPVLSHRVRALAEHRRTADLAARALAAADAATDGIAVLGPGGTIAFANEQFARQFGYDRDDLPGHPWRALFAAETADRIEADALSAVADGWQWLGTCEGRQADGDAVTLRTRVTGGGGDAVVLAVVQQSSETPG